MTAGTAPALARAEVGSTARTTSVRPALVIDVEVTEPLSPVQSISADGARYRGVWLLVRVFGEPIALVPVEFTAEMLSVAALVDTIRADCGDVIEDRVRSAGGDVNAVRAGRGTHVPSRPAFLANRVRWHRDGPPITVVVCTRNRTADLARSLQSLAAQTYGRYQVLVVDNAPADDDTAALVARLSARDARIAYSRETRPGLSWARNHALARITDPVVAWLDDDEVADPDWLMEIAAGFVDNPGAVAVSGAVVPAELETSPQLWFEQYGGHTKGRGFVPAAFCGRTGSGQHPLYPLPAFGVGANMAFSVTALREVGGFDTALGAGTPTLGGEDTLAFSQLLLAGGTVVYRPSALTRHYHRRDYDSLAQQMTGYGIGLTAYYASLVRHDWRLVFSLVRLAPHAVRDTFGSGGHRLDGVPDTFPRELLRLKTRGMLKGPLAYVRARRIARRLQGRRG